MPRFSKLARWWWSLVCAVAAGAAAPVAPLAPARFLPIGEAWAGSSVNVVANRRHALFTHQTRQFAAYYDADGVMVLARRELGQDTWESRATDYRGNVADAHNAISLAVDGAGFLHVAWDHHGQPLNYARSVAPGSLELGPRTAMTGRAEDRVTYPEFHLLPDGDLVCLYRDGRSGRGRLILNRYRTAGRRWETLQDNLIDGGDDRSPYWGATIDRRGRLHLAWIWRDSPDVATNHDLAYAASPDGGSTWETIDGRRLQPPFTYATSDYAVRIPTGHHLMNSPWVTTDWQNRPYLTTYWADSPDSPPQFRLVYRDGNQWRVDPVTARTEGFTLSGAATRRPPISRGVVLVEGWQDRPALHFVYRDDALGGRVILRTSAQLGSGQWSERALTAGSVDAWEPVIDPVQWQRLQHIQLLVQRAAQRDGDDHAAAPAAPTTIGVLRVAPRELRVASAAPRTSTGSADEEPPATALTAADVIAVMRKVADWQLANPPARESWEWHVAPLQLGLLALDRLVDDDRYRNWVQQQGEQHDWKPGPRVYHADDHCVIQPYLELYSRDGDARLLEPSRQRLEGILANPSRSDLTWNARGSQERWDWCDALFMAPASWLMMWEATGDRRFLDFMDREWWATTESLFEPAVGWYYRDQSFLDQREPNGRTVHWSRGNGWVAAGLARVLERLPSDHPSRSRYLELYQRMMRAALAAQQPDGLWRAGLLDPVAHPAREATGSSFLTYALTWGINRGLLPREQAEPPVRRAWRALTGCVRPDGKLAHCQPVGDAPVGFDPEHTEPFGVGAFLLAGSEIARLQPAPIQ